MSRLIAISAAVAATAFVGGIAMLTLQGPGRDGFDTCRTAAIAGGPGSIGGPFELVNAAGQTVTEKDVLTKPSLVYFGYTFCPDVCPLDTVRNAEAVDLLGEMGHDVTPVFITVDPDRDTPEVVGDFAANIHEDMIALTGSSGQVRAASQAYRTYYKAHNKEDEYYLVDHSTFTYLMHPEHGFLDFFKRELPPERLAEQVSCFLEAA